MKRKKNSRKNPEFFDFKKARQVAVEPAAETTAAGHVELAIPVARGQPHLEIDRWPDHSKDPAMPRQVRRGGNHGRREKVRVVDAQGGQVRTGAPGGRSACNPGGEQCHKTKRGQSQQRAHWRSVMTVGARHNRGRQTCGL